MEERNDQVRLSRGFRLFQLYSMHTAGGCGTGFFVLSLEKVKSAFVLADLVTLYALFLVGVITIGVLACIASGGIGLLRLINAKRLLKLYEKEESIK